MIGRHGRISCDEARAIARDWLCEVEKGLDPAAEKQRKRKALSTSDLLDRYLDEYATQHKKASTVKEDRRLIESKIRPASGSTPAETVCRADVHRLHQKFRETPYEANRVLALLSKVFNLAEAWGLRADGSNPCRHVKKFNEIKRSRFYSEAELQRIGTTLNAASERATEDEAVLNCIRLLALTGCRLSEVVGLRWEWIDLPQGVIRLPDSKTGARTVMISAATGAILRPIAQEMGFVLSGSTSDISITVNMVEHCDLPPSEWSKS